MFPKTFREACTVVFWMSWTLLIWVYTTTPQHNLIGEGFLAVAALSSTISLLTIWAGGKSPDPVDIWEPQRKLMKASGQSAPVRPALTNDSLLYIFLVLEELSEFADHAHDVLIRRWVNERSTPERLDMEKRLQLIAGLKRCADAGRDELAVLESICIPLDLSQAIALTDDVTDVAVVTAGLSVATGLPGGAAYDEVVTSNLSKRNPTTGKIDKEPDGKWVKGVKYRAPDLRRHLLPFYEGC